MNLNQYNFSKSKRPVLALAVEQAYLPCKGIVANVAKRIYIDHGEG